MYQQPPPYCVQIELVEGCNLRCQFCGLNGIRGKENNFKYLHPGIASAIAVDMAKLQWNSRIEFAMHGEPSTHPDFLQIIKIFRQHLPKNYMMMESNGFGFVKDPLVTIPQIFEAGLNCLALDEYEGINLVPKIKEKVYPRIAEGIRLWDAAIFEYPKYPKGNPHQRVFSRRLIFISPLNTSTHGTHSTLNNHCGSGSPLSNEADGKRCAKPFRELSFRWDGGVSVCCNDWRGVLAIGNIGGIGLNDLWHHPLMEAARRKLYWGERDFGPCLGCNAISYRTGLLPDPLGKKDLPKADEAANQLLGTASKLVPLTQPVLRPWEH